MSNNDPTISSRHISMPRYLRCGLLYYTLLISDWPESKQCLFMMDNLTIKVPKAGGMTVIGVANPPYGRFF